MLASVVWSFLDFLKHGKTNWNSFLNFLFRKYKTKILKPWYVNVRQSHANNITLPTSVDSNVDRKNPPAMDDGNVRIMK